MTLVSLIAAVVAMPGAPALVPAVMGAAAAELEAVRQAAVDAVTAAVDSVSVAMDGVGAHTARPVPVVVAPSAATAEEQRPGRWAGAISTADFGPDHVLAPLVKSESAACSDLDIPTLMLGPRWVLGEAARRRPEALAWDRLTWGGDRLDGPAPIKDQPPVPIVVVVVCDGAASHGHKGPLPFDAEAAAYDEELTAAWASGDPSRLASIDVAVGERLGAASASLLPRVASWLAPGPWQADARHLGAPSGVGYLVATWTRPPA